MLIEEKQYCTITYDAERKTVIQTWRGFAGSQNFRASILKTIEVFQQYEAHSIIGNTLTSEVVKQADADWVANYANPILRQHGLRRIAFIVPESVLAQWSVERFVREADEASLMIEYFDCLDNATAWIAEHAGLYKENRSEL